MKISNTFNPLALSANGEQGCPVNIVFYGTEPAKVLSAFEQHKADYMSNLDIQDLHSIKVEHLPDLLPDVVVFSRIDEFEHIHILKALNELGSSGVILLTASSVQNAWDKLTDYGLTIDGLKKQTVFREA